MTSLIIHVYNVVDKTLWQVNQDCIYLYSYSIYLATCLTMQVDVAVYRIW